MKLLFIGDIVGKPGRGAVEYWVPRLRERYGGLEFVIANAENAAGGHGLTQAIAAELTGYGVDFLTTGNHVWDQKEFVTQIERVPNVVRPANLPPNVPGRGTAVARTRAGVSIGIINIGGRLSFTQYDNPFLAMSDLLPPIREQTRLIVVDMHAEATSEKIAMGRYLDGRVTLVVGTHTHVQTADETVLPKGTAYITDVGMTGPHDSVIGVDTQQIIQRFLTAMPGKFEVATGDARLSAVCVEADETTGRAVSIERLCLRVPGT